ncbi:hypothetical protein RYH73_00400 [Olivibacter sp. CPCC 100613]|uniref:glycerophosphoryl diester phosphodiesterase membrane domain-containing protein n=1 Tax=Olivibacter sp. CPCC 100613 TaxID=3079931 RepID=UPI002FF5B5FF
MNEEPIELRRVRDFSETMNDSFGFIKQHFKNLFKPLLYLGGFFIVATIASSVAQQMKTIKLMGLAKAASSTVFAENMTGYTFGVSYFLLLLFSVLSVSVVYLVTYCYIRLYKEQPRMIPSLQAIWNLFKRHIISFFIATLLLSIFAVIGFLFCLIPGFYLIPIISLTLPIMIMEDKGLFEALSRSIQLVKDHWWKTFGLLFLASVIAYFSMGILSLPSALLSIGALFIENSPGLVLSGSIFGSILTGLAQLFYVLPAIVSAIWYFSLSEEKDGLSLMERIDTFGSGGTRSSDHWPEEEY